MSGRNGRGSSGGKKKGGIDLDDGTLLKFEIIAHSTNSSREGKLGCLCFCAEIVFTDRRDTTDT